MALQRWFKKRAVKRVSSAKAPCLNAEAFWRTVACVRRPVLLVKADCLRVLSATEEALEIFKGRGLKEITQALSNSLNAPTQARLEMALKSQAVIEKMPFRLWLAEQEIQVQLTVSPLPEHPESNVGLVFLEPLSAPKLIMPRMMSDILGCLPHPAWVQNAQGELVYANMPFTQFPLRLDGAGLPLDNMLPADAERVRHAQATLDGLPKYVRLNQVLSDVSLDLGSLGCWRVLHFPLGGAGAEALVCALAVRLDKVAQAEGVLPGLEGLADLVGPEVMTRLRQVRENERMALGREIHDSLGQELTVLKLELRRLQNQVVGDGTMVNAVMLENFKSVRDRVDQLTMSARRIAYELRQDFVAANGLAHTAQELVLDLRSRISLQVQLEISPNWVEPEGGMVHHLHRSLQELLNNVSKHAKASRCLVRLDFTNDVYSLEVRDDGVGMSHSPASLSLGMRSLRERADIYGGTVVFKTRPEVDGTLVRIELPERRRRTPVGLLEKGCEIES